jgi:hypothetical protein
MSRGLERVRAIEKDLTDLFWRLLPILVRKLPQTAGCNFHERERDIFEINFRLTGCPICE